jgi:ribosomal protein S18 acetylase RimI-like enzyme
MQHEDTKAASRATKEAMLDSWEKREKNYYPKEALDFDISVHSPKDYRDFLRPETNYACIAEQDNKIIGIAMVTIVGKSGLARLGWIGVHPSHQKRGVGTALLEDVVEHCKSRKCHKITLYTLPVLIPAINLYLKFGFVPETYLHKEWWNVDFIKMSKWL